MALTTEPRLDDLEKLLETSALTGELEGAAGFIQRCDAIDRLELQLARLSDATGSAAALRDRAIGLQRRLLQGNAAVVDRLRGDIEAGRLAGGDLAKELQRYDVEPLRNENDGNLGYDPLDVLVAGILGTDRLEDEALAATLPEMVAYQPTPARVVLEMVRLAKLGPDDVFVDLGSGLGIVPTLVSLLSGAPSIGIEVQPSYCRHAEECARRLKLRNVRFVCQDAREADFSVGTVFYMYTPFKGAMLQQVLGRLAAEARRRRIRLCTYGPVLAEAVKQLGLAPREVSAFPQGPITVFESDRG